MEQGLDRLEKEVSESNKKIQELASLVQNLNVAIKEPENLNNADYDDTLSRIEKKLDGISQSESEEYINIFLSELKQNLEEKQKALITKISFIEELTNKISSVIISQDSNITGNEEKIKAIKGNLDILGKSFNNFEKNISLIVEKIEKMPSEGSKDELVKIVKDIKDNVLFNLSAIGAIDVKIKTISGNLNSIISVKETLESVYEKSDKIFELLQSASLKSDIVELKNEIDIVNKEFSGLKIQIDSLFSNDIASLKDIVTISSQKADHLLGRNDDLFKEIVNLGSILFSVKNTSSIIESNLEHLSTLDEIEPIKENIIQLTSEIKHITNNFNEISGISSRLALMQESIENLLSRENAGLNNNLEIIKNSLFHLSESSNPLLANSMSSKNDLNVIKDKIISVNENLAEFQNVVNSSIFQNISFFQNQLNEINETTQNTCSLIMDINSAGLATSEESKILNGKLIQEINTIKDSFSYEINIVKEKLSENSENSQQNILNKINSFEEYFVNQINTLQTFLSSALSKDEIINSVAQAENNLIIQLRELSFDLKENSEKISQSNLDKEIIELVGNLQRYQMKNLLILRIPIIN